MHIQCLIDPHDIVNFFTVSEIGTSVERPQRSASPVLVRSELQLAVFLLLKSMEQNPHNVDQTYPWFWGWFFSQRQTK